MRVSWFQNWRKGGKRLLPKEDVPEYDLWLACTGGLLRGSVFPITEQTPVTIGREDGSAFRYPGGCAGISRRHAQVYWDRGRLLLVDLNSATGVRMEGGELLPPMRPREVRPGDAFCVGDDGRNRFEIRN